MPYEFKQRNYMTGQRPTSENESVSPLTLLRNIHILNIYRLQYKCLLHPLVFLFFVVNCGPFVFCGKTKWNVSLFFWGGVLRPNCFINLLGKSSIFYPTRFMVVVLSSGCRCVAVLAGRAVRIGNLMTSLRTIWHSGANEASL